MSTCSLVFLAFCCLVAIVLQLLPGKLLRHVLLSAINVAFLWPLVPNLWSWLWFVFFIGATYSIIRMTTPGTSASQLGIALGMMIFAFICLKGYLLAWMGEMLSYKLFGPLYWFNGYGTRAADLVGLSYMLFKFIHVAVDRWQNQSAPCNFITYANYQLSFFTLVAGPIQRYNDFHQYWEAIDRPVAGTRQTLLAWSRILTGMIKMGAIAPIFYAMFEQAKTSFAPQPTASLVERFAVWFYAYPFYMYFNFAGYTDVVIGAAKLLGFDLPENFDRPFLARNIVDFWNRWHITLTHWIRDYVFMTSYKAVAERFPKAGKYLGYGLLFGSLLLAGVWHGATPGYAVFGAIHGLGAAAGRAYGDAMKFLLGRGGMQLYLKSKLIHAAAVVATFHFVCFSFLFFSSGGKAVTILGSVFSRLRTPLNSGPSFQPELLPLLGLLPWLAATWQPRAQRTSLLCLAVLLKTILVVLLFCWLWASEQKDPVVIYMRF
jgi:D-alanyl-lipoteichoic acid acyltransferase DltB (MBOAT superfamily)